MFSLNNGIETAQLRQCIVTNIALRGDGKKTPIRQVTQVYDGSGDLISEDDPCAYTPEKLLEIWGELPSNATLDDFIKKIEFINQ